MSRWRVEIGANDDARPDYLRVDAYGTPDVLADMRALPFRNLDEIHASHVLEHLPDGHVIGALASCRRALAPEGRLILYVPDLLWVMRRFLKAASGGERWGLFLRYLYGSQENEGQYHRTGFSAQRLGACLVAAGFRRVKTRRARRKERYGQQEVFAEARP